MTKIKEILSKLTKDSDKESVIVSLSDEEVAGLSFDEIEEIENQFNSIPMSVLKKIDTPFYDYLMAHEDDEIDDFSGYADSWC